MKGWLLIMVMCLGFGLHAQETDSILEKIKFIHPYKFWDPSEQLNKPRVITVTTGLAATYGLANIWFAKAWYAQFDKERFHFFNDASEWLQLDKAGHVTSAYYINRLSHDLYNWAGLKEHSAMWAGVGVAQAYQLLIEIQDGFSAEWGFSWTDIAANVSGSLIYAAQHYAWGEQRFVIKESAWPYNHPDEFQDRADDLYGETFGEQFLKDYNATTFWLTVSPGSFIKREHKFPDWIGISVGYGGRGMYGGFKNTWCDADVSKGDTCPPEDLNTSAIDVPRVREFYLSLDIDFTKIKTKSNALKAFLEIINIIKIPFPALEFYAGDGGGVRWHWIKF